MKKQFITGLMAFLFIACATAAPIETFKFDSRQHEQLFQKLSEGLRCLVCQNEAIAESNADLAKDLRRQVYNMIEQGKTEDQIKAYMVQRYGDYVLFRPPFKPLTWLLWLGPGLLFVLSIIFVLKIIRHKADKPEEDELSPAELERIKKLHTEKMTTSVDQETKHQ